MDEIRVDALAAAYQAGRAKALPALVDDLARPLLAQAYRYVRDWDLAADLVQETWLRVVGSIAAYDARRPFSPWIRTILRRQCLQHLARDRSRPAGVPLTAATIPASQRPADDPDRSVRDAELRRRLARHLATLGRTQRRAVELVDIEQCDRRQAAAELGLTGASLRVVLHRARRRLAGLLLAEETS